MDDKELKTDIFMHVFGLKYACVYIEIKSSKMHDVFEQGVVMIRKDLVGVRDPGEWPSLNGWQRRKHGDPRGEAPSP